MFVFLGLYRKSWAMRIKAQILGVFMKFSLGKKNLLRMVVSSNAKHQGGIWRELYFLCKISIVAWQTMGALGDWKAVRMNRESAGCVRVSAWGLCPKAPFSACHNKVAQGLVFPGSLAIFYYSTLHNKKHLLISADQRPLLKQEKGRKRGGREREKKIEKPWTDPPNTRATIGSFSTGQRDFFFSFCHNKVSNQVREDWTFLPYPHPCFASHFLSFLLWRWWRLCFASKDGFRSNCQGLISEVYFCYTGR